MSYMTKSRFIRLVVAGLFLVPIGLVIFGKSMSQEISPDLTITSPKDGTVITPGQTITVEVTVAPTASFSDVGIVVEDIGFGPNGIKSTPPYNYSITIPSNLIGKKKVTAFGMTGPDTAVYSAPITLDIEIPTFPESLSVDPTGIDFKFVGEQIPISVIGNYSDGTSADITYSSNIAYKSENTSIATVDTQGMVTDAGPGSTAVIVTIGSLSIGVPISAPAVGDTIPPVTVATLSQQPSAAGWNNSDVTIQFVSTDNEPGGTGVKSINVTLSGAQTGKTVFSGGTASVAVSMEGTTTISYFGVDNAGNQESPKTLTVKLDKTPPAITGMPAVGCSLWPPNHKLVQVATVSSADSLSGLATFTVTGASNEPSDPNNSDIVITGAALGPQTVQLRAERLGTGTGRIYTITASASDVAGNVATQSAVCLVPHDQGVKK